MWNPPDQISKKEMVGRRAFGEDKKIFSDEKATKYKINVFFDDRVDEDLSFDRLGVRQAMQEVLSFLCPLGDALGERKSQEFRGWAQIKVEQLTKISMKKTEAVEEINPYHAELIRDYHRNIVAARSLAFELSVKASEHDFIQRPIK